METHPGERILFSGHPSWRSTMAFYLKGLALALVAGAVAWLAKSSDHKIAALVALGVFAVVLVVGFLKRIGTSYTVTDERLHIRRGILAKHVQETRIERVQNVNVDQSIMQRVLRVGTVDFDTAGTTDSDFAFRGVGSPEDVVQAVDRAHRERSEPAPTPEPAADTDPPPPADTDAPPPAAQ
jgi:uncharacterized membrane protein YdbT with pleckstrin-like domain